MKTRYSFGGDEHIFAEIDETMSLQAFFKSLSITSAVRESRIAGVTEICPANASFQIKFDPDKISPADMLAALTRLESAADKSASVIKTRIIEIPVLYNDPWTHETLMRFRERHQDPTATDLEYAARVNNLGTVQFRQGAFGRALVRVDGRFCRRLAVSLSDGRASAADRGAEIFEAAHRHTETDRRSRRLLQLHLFGARRGRLSDVRHHADADLRPQPGHLLPSRRDVPVQSGRHRQMEADHARGVRPGGRRCRGRQVRAADARRHLFTR